MLNFLHDSSFGKLIAGVDEAGRGPLAGPVVCAACIMGDICIEGIYDSKKISPLKLKRLYKLIVANALDFCVVAIDSCVVDQINILNATKLGMTLALQGLVVKPELVLIDYVKLNVENSISIVKGDLKSYNVAAASILAKVSRDNLMSLYSILYPDYNFEKHKGYPTKLHYEAIKNFGVTAIHRTSFLNNYEYKKK